MIPEAQRWNRGLLGGKVCVRLGCCIFQSEGRAFARVWKHKNQKEKEFSIAVSQTVTGGEMAGDR